MAPEHVIKIPIMYGIANCNTIRKARSWLTQNGIDYEFHDYKKQGPDEKQLKTWINELGWEQLINRRGTSWRKLDQDTKSTIDESSAIRIMLHNPSIIKRPLLVLKSRQILGFDEHIYQQVFLSS